MTLVTGTVQDLGYDGMDGTLWARPARFRSDGQVVYAPERTPFKITGGVVSAELAPGPAVLTLQVGSHARGTFEVVIPDQAEIGLADLMDAVFPWTPAQVSLFVAEREAAEQAKADAEQAATLAGTAKTDAELAAQQTGQDRTAVATDKNTVVAHVQALAEPNDAAVLGLISEGADTATKAALNDTYGRSLAAKASSWRVEAWPSGEPIPRLLDSTSTVWGSSGSSVYSSTDGDSWTLAFSIPAANDAVVKILECQDGALLVFGAKGAARVANPRDASPTVVQKFQANGSAEISRFGVTGSTKMGVFAVTEYGPGSESWADSRYGTASWDDGHTWTRVWDSDQDAVPANQPAESHVHGVCYDEHEDALYLCEGHGPGSGIYRSTNFRELSRSWHKPENMQTTPPPTTLVPTVDGLVGGSDSSLGGIVGIPRSGPVDSRMIRRVVPWRVPHADGVIGFGADAVRDDRTGTVYTSFYAAHENTRPIITASSATGGVVLWEWPGTQSGAGNSISDVGILPDGRLIARAFMGGVQYKITLWPEMDRSPSTSDLGNVLGGRSVANTSVAVGAGARIADQSPLGTPVSTALAIGTESLCGDARGSAIGSGSESTGFGSIAVGYKATTGGNGAITMGAEAEATNSAINSILIGVSTKCVSANAVQIGMGTSTSGENNLALSFPVAVGQNAKVIGGEGTSVGSGSSSGFRSVAIGRAAIANSSYGTAVGQESSSGTGGVSVGRHAVASGNYAVSVGMEASASHAQSVAIGYQSSASGIGSVAVGANVVVTEPYTVGFGPRSLWIEPVPGVPPAPTEGVILFWESGELKTRDSAGVVRTVSVVQS